MNRDWYEDDKFWTTMAPVIFSDAQWNRAEFEIDDLEELVELPGGARVLDLACGTGRHAIELAARGYDVTGVDLTEAYLEEAKRRAGRDGLNVEWVKEDMRDFRRPDTYDLAVCLYTSLGYFDDEGDHLKVLRNVHDSLKPDGRFVVEVAGKEFVASDFRESSWDELDDGTLFLAQRSVEGPWEWINNRWILVGHDGDRQEFQMRHRLYSGVELRKLFEEAGFRRVDLYGSLDGQPYDRNARSLVAVAAP